MASVPLRRQDLGRELPLTDDLARIKYDEAAKVKDFYLVEELELDGIQAVEGNKSGEGLAVRAPSECPTDCSGRGRCISRGASHECRCYSSTYKGKFCEKECPGFGAYVGKCGLAACPGVRDPKLCVVSGSVCIMPFTTSMRDGTTKPFISASLLSLVSSSTSMPLLKSCCLRQKNARC